MPRECAPSGLGCNSTWTGKKTLYRVREKSEDSCCRRNINFDADISARVSLVSVQNQRAVHVGKFVTWIEVHRSEDVCCFHVQHRISQSNLHQNQNPYPYRYTTTRSWKLSQSPWFFAGQGYNRVHWWNMDKAIWFQFFVWRRYSFVSSDWWNYWIVRSESILQDL